MVRYWYAWTPLVIVGTVVLLSLPWLGLIALMVVALVALVALAALAWAIVLVPYRLGRAISRRGHARRGASPRTAVYRHPYPYVASQRIYDPAPQLARSTHPVRADWRDGAPGQRTFRKRQVS
jgi:hypothetical protein